MIKENGLLEHFLKINRAFPRIAGCFFAFNEDAEHLQVNPSGKLGRALRFLIVFSVGVAIIVRLILKKKLTGLAADKPEIGEHLLAAMLLLLVALGYWERMRKAGDYVTLLNGLILFEKTFRRNSGQNLLKSSLMRTLT